MVSIIVIDCTTSPKGKPFTLLNILFSTTPSSEINDKLPFAELKFPSQVTKIPSSYFSEIGINGLGLSLVQDDIIIVIKNIVSFPIQNNKSSRNFSYFPILLESEKVLKELQFQLEKSNIYTRRYFFPSLDTLKYINPSQFCPISRDISSRVLCLPMYPQLLDEDIFSITKIIKNQL